MDIDTERTSEFNEYITTIIDELINNNQSNISIEITDINTNINDYLENVMIYNMFGNNFDFVLNNSFDEDKGLERNDDVQLMNCIAYKGDKDVECSICMCDENVISNGCSVYKCEKCNNVFHESCMSEWVKMKIECPMCRHCLDKDVKHIDAFEEWIKDNIDI